MSNNLPENLLNDSKNKWDAFLAAAQDAGIHPPEDPLFVERLRNGAEIT